MKNPRPIHFEINAVDPERTAKFYSDVFGWKFEKWETPEANMDYWMVMTGDKETMGINGGMSKQDQPQRRSQFIHPDYGSFQF